MTDRYPDERQTQERSRILLQLLSLPGMDEARLCSLFDRLAATGIRIEELGDHASTYLVSRLGFSAEQAARFVSPIIDSVEVAHWLPGDGVCLLTRADSTWPAHLLKDHARQATPWLYLQGDPGILAHSAIGIAGSRDATDQSLLITNHLATELVGEGRTIVSGGANGIDTTAHDAALAAGGHTIVVLAQGIGTFRPPRRWQDAISEGRMLVVSEYLPKDIWDAPRAIRRNATIVQLSDAFVVVQAGAPSGTLSAGQSAIRMKWPLYVVRQIGEDAETFSGNDLLIRRGGTPLDVSCGQPLSRQVVNEVLASAVPASPPMQLGLFS